ncbi:MAG TPA: EFR1 family ferrodoxin [Coriobacteriia bacterium]
MKGAIYYYSGTGNTALACQYITHRMPIPFELADVTSTCDVDLEQADIVGFATSTDFWGVPRVLETFIDGLPRQAGKPAFVFNTFGAVSGKTLKILSELVTAKGFEVLAGHSLHMPENYPPMLAGKMASADAPSPAEIAGLDAFVGELGGIWAAMSDGRRVESHKLRLGFFDNLVPRRRRTTARKDMGEKFVDESACTECGTCERNCPYGAIRLGPRPIFDMSECHGCWRCYNQCPSNAIYTDKFRGGPYYPGPNELLRAKLES